jgi:hypothetical protein
LSVDQLNIDCKEWGMRRLLGGPRRKFEPRMTFLIQFWSQSNGLQDKIYKIGSRVEVKFFLICTRDQDATLYQTLEIHQVGLLNSILFFLGN